MLAPRPRRRVRVVNLTRRQCEILALLVEGRTNKEIAGALCIAVPTVKEHFRNIYDRLGVSNRTQAAVLAMRMEGGDDGDHRG